MLVFLAQLKPFILNNKLSRTSFNAYRVNAIKKSEMAIQNLDELEKAVRQLSDEDLAQFRVWFAEFDAEAWDKQFEADIFSGRLDTLAEKALKDLRQGNCKDL
jgi:hypothetical protein